MLYEGKVIFFFNIKTFLKLKCTKVCNEFAAGELKMYYLPNLFDPGLL